MTINWHDISLWLWSLVVTAFWGFVKFISWISTREIKNFWKNVDERLDQKNSELKNRMQEIERKFSILCDDVHSLKHCKKTEHKAQHETLVILYELQETINKLQLKNERKN
jgi:hypothetical protein